MNLTMIFLQPAEFTLIKQIRKQTTTEETRKLQKKTRKLLDFKTKNYTWIESRIK